MGFPGDSDAEESTCSAGDSVQSLGQEEVMAIHSSILPGEFHGQRSLVGYNPWAHIELDMTERLMGSLPPSQRSSRHGRQG